MKSAVLLIVFNRPEPTGKVFEAIRRARPERLYVAADGPRVDRPGEWRRCEEVRRLTTNVDWPCQLETLFQAKNLGCGRGVSSAINWFFEHEDEGIILEDDCLPAPSFFSYCDAMLERYRDDERIAQVSGSNFIGAKVAKGASYFFSNYPDIWGWATWRRSWEHFDVSMAEWPLSKRISNFIKVADGDLLVEAYWRKIFDDTWRGKIDTWDYQWIFSCWRRGSINIIPAENLVENLGFGDDATHTTHSESSFLQKPGELSFPLVHPVKIEASREADHLISKLRYGISLYSEIVSKLRRIPILSDILKGAKKRVVQLTRG